LHKADPGAQSAQITLVFREPPERRHDRRTEQREVAAVERKLDIRQG
jgi:hypothetical protein